MRTIFTRTDEPGYAAEFRAGGGGDLSFRYCQDIDEDAIRERRAKVMAFPEISYFESKYVMQIILFLKKKGPCIKSDIYDEVTTNPKVKEVIATLEEKGIVMVSDRHKFNSHIITLTEKGEKIADLIQRIVETIEEG